MPRIDDLIDEIGPAKYISTLDLLIKRLSEVPIIEVDRHETGFITSYGLYQYQLVPFGLLWSSCYFPTNDGQCSSSCK